MNLVIDRKRSGNRNFQPGRYLEINPVLELGTWSLELGSFTFIGSWIFGSWFF